MKEYGDTLSIALQTAVPLWIMAMSEKGGPDAEDMERARKTSDLLGAKGDLLFFTGKKKGETARVFNELAHSISVLSFCPGGVTTFGQHYESKIPQESC